MNPEVHSAWLEDMELPHSRPRGRPVHAQADTARLFAPRRNPAFSIRHPDGTVHERVLIRQPYDPGDNDAQQAWLNREFGRTRNHYARGWRTVPLMHQCCGAEEQIRVRYDRDGNPSPESELAATLRVFAHWYSCDG